MHIATVGKSYKKDKPHESKQINTLFQCLTIGYGISIMTDT
jgi:hypothetical protein